MPDWTKPLVHYSNKSYRCTVLDDNFVVNDGRRKVIIKVTRPDGSSFLVYEHHDGPDSGTFSNPPERRTIFLPIYESNAYAYSTLADARDGSPSYAKGFLELTFENDVPVSTELHTK